MPLDLLDALELSARLEKAGQREKRALVDFHAFGQYKQSAASFPLRHDRDALTKLAATVALDNFLSAELEKAAASDQPTHRACLLLNRERGIELLRKLI